VIDLLNEVTNVRTDLLFLIVLGQSGAGKSHVVGTAPGKILYLYLDSERHGVASASKNGANVIGICLDRDKQGNARKADEAYKYGLACLDPEALKKAGVTSVVIDGLTELEKLIRLTSEFDSACETKTGKRDAFKEPAETVRMLDKYMAALRNAQDRAGVHVIMTGILDVSEVEANGAVATAKPRATAYAVAEGVIQQFPDILVVGKITKKDGTSGRAFQTDSDLVRVSKDEDKKVKRFINFSPRLSGVSKIPAFIAADLSEVVKLKSGNEKNG
jgi:hypothetical protein